MYVCMYVCICVCVCVSVSVCVRVCVCVCAVGVLSGMSAPFLTYIQTHSAFKCISIYYRYICDIIKDGSISAFSNTYGHFSLALHLVVTNGAFNAFLKNGELAVLPSP